MKKIILSLALCLFVLQAFAMNVNPDSVFTVKTRLYYPVNVTKSVESYMGNTEALKILSTLNKPDFDVVSIKITGWASPEATTKYNQMLSDKRAETVKGILKSLYRFPESVYETEGKGEQWGGITALVNSDNKMAVKYMDAFKLALATENEDAREAALKRIGNGEFYRYLYKNIYPEQRFADCEVMFKCNKVIEEEDAKVLAIAPAPVFECKCCNDTVIIVETPVPAPVKKGFWRISLSAGPQVYWGDNDKYMMRNNFFHSIRFGVTGDIQRWFNDYIGIGLGFNTYKMHGLYHDRYAALGDNPSWRKEDRGMYLKRDAVGYYEQSGFIFDPYLYVTTNLINDFGGVKEGGRIYNLLLSIGAGVPFSEDTNNRNMLVGFSINGSLVNTFRVSKVLDINISLNGGAMQDNFDGEVSRHMLDGTYSIMAGIGVHF